MAILSSIIPSSKVSKLNYLYIFYVIIVDAVNKLILSFDGKMRIPLILSIVSIICSLNEKNSKKYLFSFPIIFWFLWCVYNIINSFIKGFPSSEEYEINIITIITKYFVIPFCSMAIISYEGYKDIKKTTMLLVCSFMLFIILGVFLQERGTGEGSSWEARGMMQLGNTLPLNSLVLFFVSIFAYANSYIKKKYFIIISFLVVLSILLVATRKAFAGVLIIGFFYLFSQIDYRNPKTFVKFIGALIIVYIFYSLIMKYTLIGARIDEGVEQQTEIYVRGYNTDSWFFELVGDRTAQYIMAWEIFLEHPLTGIGLFNFKSYTDFVVPLHTEYMVELAECGLVGFTLYALFYWGLIKRIFTCWKFGNEQLAIVMFGGVFAILFISLTTWIYPFQRNFIMLGIIIAMCDLIISNHKDQ